MSQSLKIAIIGYGKMGHEIEKHALALGHQVVCIIDNEKDWESFPAKAEVAIEFTTPNTAPKNILRCFNAGVPVVCGTTGWHQHLPEISETCLQKQQTLFYASNFSLGVNIFFEINRRLAALLKSHEEYKPSVTEVHHTQKLDAPSGTAIVIAKEIMEANPHFAGWKLAGTAKEENQIPIEALRIEKVPGTHSVCWEGLADTIEIKHTAHNRSGFAKGALLAAQWVNKKKGIFTMKDLLNL
jgi:4-hydroxy-tetrahydrodipicolinate reductase